MRSCRWRGALQALELLQRIGETRERACGALSIDRALRFTLERRAHGSDRSQFAKNSTVCLFDRHPDSRQDGLCIHLFLSIALRESRLLRQLRAFRGFEAFRLQQLPCRG